VVIPVFHKYVYGGIPPEAYDTLIDPLQEPKQVALVVDKLTVICPNKTFPEITRKVIIDIIFFIAFVVYYFLDVNNY